MRKAQIVVENNEKIKSKKSKMKGPGIIKKIRNYFIKKVENSVSFFKTVEFYLDHLSRKKVNSWKMFFDNIYPDGNHFTLEKMTEEEYLPEVSMRLDVLNDKYEKY